MAADKKDGTQAPQEFFIQGMHCVNCAQNIERVLSEIPEIERADVHFAMQSANITWKDPANHSEDTVIDAVTALGYKAGLKHASKQMSSPIAPWRNTAAFLFAAIFLADMILGWAGSALRLNLFSTLLLASFCQFALGGFFYRNAWTALKSGYFTMDSLIAIGTSAAYILSVAQIPWTIIGADPWAILSPAPHSYFEAAVLVICFVYIGQYFEQKSTARARKDLSDLSLLLGTHVIIEIPGTQKKIPLRQLKSDHIVIIEPGSRIPADGIIVSGQSEIDQSMLTGEPMPVTGNIGDKVFAGTINLTHVLKIKAVNVGISTRLGYISKLVQAAASSKPEAAKRVDQICNFFVPLVLGIAAITFILWAGYDLSQNQPISRAVLNAVAVLVIACPCALGLATPIVVMSSISLAARENLLIKNAAVLESMPLIDTMVFDKTGTLTFGKPMVTDIIAPGKDSHTILRLAASAAQNSNHPMSKAIALAASDQSIALLAPLQVQEIPGQGLIAEFIMGKTNPSNPLVQADAIQQRIYVGNRRLLNAHFFDLSPLEGGAEELALDGKSMVFIGQQSIGAGDKKQALGVIGLADQLRPKSRELIHALKSRDIKILLLTGDTKASAMRVAQSLGIDDVQADIIPEEKAGRIQSLKQRGRKIAMLGDGINDAAALASAEVGIAVAGGSDLAMEAANVGLLRPDPWQVIRLLQLGDLFRRKVKENLFWAFGFNIVGIPLAAVGLLHPAMAGAMMSASSILVVGNAFRMRLKK